MFFPFTNYKRITFSSETEGVPSVKYTTTAKSFITIEVPANGVGYDKGTGVNCWYNNTGTTQISIFSWNPPLGGTSAIGDVIGEAISGSAVVPSGYKIAWAANNSAGPETITLHVYELPTTLP